MTAVETLGLVQFDAARLALAEAHGVDEVKTIRDQAQAMTLYLKQHGASGEMQNHAAEIKLRAERRLGAMLREMPKRDGGDAARTRFHRASELPPKLSDLGINHSDSHRWQLEAAIPEELFEAHVAETLAKPHGELTSAALVKLARDVVRTDNLPNGTPSGIPADGTYTTIVADPPWQYTNVATRAAANDHYPTLSIPEICALQVSERHVSACAADAAHLYLWTTNAFLRQAFEVIDNWGFEYKTTLVWVKPQLGIGNYFRSSHEFVLFAVRGGLRVIDSNQRSWFEVDRGRHSLKPAFFYELVEKVSPGPYLELFARPDMFGARPGWTVWGNEA